MSKCQMWKYKGLKINPTKKDNSFSLQVLITSAFQFITDNHTVWQKVSQSGVDTEVSEGA